MHTVGYLLRTADMGLAYSKCSDDDFSLRAYVDSTWGSDRDTRRSRSGLALFLGNCLIEWTSAKQTLVSTSSTEAEYYALSSMAKSVLFTRQVLAQIGLRQQTTVVYGDNQGANFLSANAQLNSKTKHIGIHWHHVRQLAVTGQIRVTYIPTAKNLADMFTKPLPWAKLLDAVLVSMHVPARLLQRPSARKATAAALFCLKI